MKTLFNFLIHQSNWFISVVGASKGYPYLGVLSIGISVPLYFVFSSVFQNKRKEVIFLIVVTLFGFVFDSLLVMLHAVDLKGQGFQPYLTAPFMLVLWPNFAILFPQALRWLENRYRLAFILGFGGGPLAYFAGQKFGCITIDGLRGFLFVSLFWGVAIPTLLYLRKVIVK